MGITVNYQRISLERLTELQSNSERIEQFFCPENLRLDELMDSLKQAQTQNNNKLVKQLGAELREALSQDKASVYRNHLLSQTQLSIEKEWQAIHYLLTGEIVFDKSQIKSPLGSIVMGGERAFSEPGYEHIRYLNSIEVKEITQALNRLPMPEIRLRFEQRRSTKIYAQRDEWNEEAWEFFQQIFDSLTRFFHQAAVNSEVILIY
ncbi:MAG: DUF1877 family protein [Oculatellaceae cyanobacterium bins.114]|nr:DUF1877 family protein [Oculatellaceae cyanobacterium bins.114]